MIKNNDNKFNLLKKFIIILCILISVCVLTGCSAKKTEIDLSGTEIKMLSSGQASSFSQSNKDGYYELANPKQLRKGFNILYTDYNTKNKIVLCSSTSCEHREESCTGYITGAPIRNFVINDKIIVFSLVEENGEYFKNIISAELNGENRKILYTLNQSESEGDEYLCDNENLYFVISKPFEKNGEILYPQILVKLNIYTGEMVEVLNLSEKFDNAYVKIVGAYKDELIVESVSSKRIIKSIKINGNQGTLKKEEFSYDDTNIKYDGKYLYCVSYKDRTFVRENLETGEQKVLNWPDNANFNVIDSSLGNVIDENILFTEIEIKKVENKSIRKDKLYVINFDNEEFYEIKLTFDYDGIVKPIVVVAQTDSHFFVMNGMKNIMHYYPESEKGITSDMVPTPQYAMISKDDFWRSNPNYVEINYIP